MSLWRQAVLGAVLLLVGSLALWGQYQKQQASNAQADLAQQQLRVIQQRSAEQARDLELLNQQLERERAAQVQLRTQHNQLRARLDQRQQQLEELTRANVELQRWAAQPLPDAAVRLRQRPALSGAQAYAKWLSAGDALPTAEQPAAH